MCGIAGIFSYHSTAASPVDPKELRLIRDSMRMRGPDGKGEYYSRDRRVGLGHRRLAIIDLSENGAQPMVGDNGNLIITYNGEIYNYRALRQSLIKKGYRFRTQSDTEVLLTLYMEKGESMVHDLRGMFAFAIWDERKKGLFLARDHFGIKPLYFADDGKTLRFASQVKALLAGGCVSTQLDPAGQVGFYLWGHLPEPYTLYRSIRSLEAGTSLWLSRTGQKKRVCYFDIGEEIKKSVAVSVDNDKMGDVLRETLLDSVQHHLIADVPVGFFLSSGLDSTTLTALGSEVADQLHTVTLGFQEYIGTQMDEVPLAEDLARQYQTDHQTVWVKNEEFAEEFDKLLTVMDQPTINGVNSYFVSKVTAATGLKVAISGVGGDELFGGYPSFTQIPQVVRKLAPLRRVSNIGKIARIIAAPFVKRLTSPKYAGVLEYGASFSGAYLLRRGLYMPWELPSLLDADTCREGLGELNTLMRLEETVTGFENEHLKVSALELTWYMRNQLLRDTDWAGMAHSLEIRVPLVDVNVFRSVVQNISAGFSLNKEHMAATPKKQLPVNVLQKRKTGFTVPVRDWLLKGRAVPIHDSSIRGLRGWAKVVFNAAIGNC